MTDNLMGSVAFAKPRSSLMHAHADNRLRISHYHSRSIRRFVISWREGEEIERRVNGSPRRNAYFGQSALSRESNGPDRCHKRFVEVRLYTICQSS